MKRWITLSLFLLIGVTNSSAQNEDYDSWVMLLADTMKNSLLYDQGKLIDSLFNPKIFAEKVFVKKGMDSLIQDFNKSYYDREFQDFGLGRTFSREIENTYYDYVNHYNSMQNNDLHILFRLVGEEGGMNYHDFQLTYSTQDSSYQVIDIFIYSIGINFSEMIAELYKNELREWLNNKSKFIKSNDASNGLRLTKQINQLLNESQPQKAFDLYKKLPINILKQKTYRYLEIKILAELDDAHDLYVQSVEAYEKDFPKDPSIYLIVMYKYFAEEQYEMALKYLNKLDIKVGLDPFLNYERGNIYYLIKDYENAQKHYEKAFQDFYYEDLYLVMIEFYYETGQFEKIIPILNAMIMDLKYQKKDIIDHIEKEYSSLASRKEFQDWKKIE